MSLFINSVKSASALLYKKGSRLKMILATVTVMFAAAFPMMMGIYLVPLLGIEGWGAYALSYGVALPLALVITLPALCMYVTYAREVYSEAKYGYADTKKRGAYNYFRSLFSAVLIFGRYAISALMMQGAYEGASWFTELLISIDVRIPFILILLPLLLMAALIVAIFLWLTAPLFLANYYYSKGQGAVKAIVNSCKKTAKRPFYSTLFALVYIGLTLISLFTVGVLFVLWVQPLMMFTYFEFADKMDER